VVRNRTYDLSRIDRFTPAFWRTCVPGSVSEDSGGSLPSARKSTSQVSLRLGRGSQHWLLRLAGCRQIGYQTLPKRLVTQRLHEEESERTWRTYQYHLPGFFSDKFVAYASDCLLDRAPGTILNLLNAPPTMWDWSLTGLDV
jgi:hypothetical protein